MHVCTCVYTEKLLIIILPAKNFCLLLIIYTIKKVDVSVQCLTHFLNTISLHYEKKLIAFPYNYMIQSIMKWFLCSAHLNFGNSTHKFLDINQFMFSFFPQLGSP